MVDSVSTASYPPSHEDGFGAEDYLDAEIHSVPAGYLAPSLADDKTSGMLE